MIPFLLIKYETVIKCKYGSLFIINAWKTVGKNKQNGWNIWRNVLKNTSKLRKGVGQVLACN